MSKLLFTKEQTAELLSISTKTLDRMVKAGEIVPVRIGDCVRFSYRELERVTRKGQELVTA